MAGKKIIAVFGATGQQGGSVVDIFLNDPKVKNEWSVRAVTRDITKESAKKLAAQGAEVVQVRRLLEATVTWREDQNVELIPVDRPTCQTRRHWAMPSSALKPCLLKAAVEEYARSLGIPAVYFMPGFYMSNLPGQMLRASPPDNTWTLALPMPESAPIPMFDISDTGKVVKSIALNREKVLGKRVLGAFKYMTPKEILEGFKSVYSEAGKTATFFSTPHDAYTDALKGMGMPEFAAIELLENMRLMDEGGYYGGESLDESHALLDDPLTTWEEFMKKSPLFSELKSDE
ncbi:NMRAL1 protein [Ilyonectria robusta]